MPNNGQIVLRPGEILAGRPFTHPQYIEPEADVLRQMRAHVLEIAGQPAHWQHLPWPRTAFYPVGDRQHKVSLLKPALVLEALPLTVVGFFGTMHAHADQALLGQVNDNLIAEFTPDMGLISYSTLQLPSGNYGNLVVFNSPDARDNWGQSTSHALAAGRLTTENYDCIRIYNGRMPAGYAGPLVIDRVKYFDYTSGSPWRAVRSLTAT